MTDVFCATAGRQLWAGISSGTAGSFREAPGCFLPARAISVHGPSSQSLGAAAAVRAATSAPAVATSAANACQLSATSAAALATAHAAGVAAKHQCIAAAACLGRFALGCDAHQFWGSLDGVA